MNSLQKTIGIFLVLTCLLCIQAGSAGEGLGVSGITPGGAGIDRDNQAEITGALSNIPLFLVPNEGQADRGILYTCKGQGYTIAYARDRVLYSVPFDDGGTEGRYVVVQRFSGGNPGPVIEGMNPLETRISYFTGPESDWHTNITPYGAIKYLEIYPGIDLVFRGVNGTIKREFIVMPGADPYLIRMTYDGAGQVRAAGNGDLVIRAGTGEIRESAPFSYQDIDGVRMEVPCRFEVRDDGSVSFSIGHYDRSLPLMIDPVLAYCGYIGGSSTEFMQGGIAVDTVGNAYVTGYTDSASTSGFPVTIGPELGYNGGFSDAFIAKVNALGTGLDYCGYIGGSGTDYGGGIAVDTAGNAYITGSTSSSEATFPVTAGWANGNTYNGDFDAFVAKVNALGNGLVYCQYIGGSGQDHGKGIAVDDTGCAYIAGSTSSTPTTFMETVGPNTSYGYGGDAFVAKANAAGNALVYCGYIGGNNDDQGNGIAVDKEGNAYVIGWTSSYEDTFPVHTGPSLISQGGGDAFVTRVKADGTGLDYCGYIGGSGSDVGYGIAVEPGGSSASVTGSTDSTEATFPVTVGPDLVYSGWTDAFVAKVNAAGTGLNYCGYIGGLGDKDIGYGIAADSYGNAYVTGSTNSDPNSFPVLEGPDLTYNGEETDAFVAKVKATGTGLDYCGYIGGSGRESGYAIAVDEERNAYIMGITSSTEATFPVTIGPDITYAGGNDDFVAKVVTNHHRIGAFRPSTHTFYLDYNGNGAWNGPVVDRAYNFGLTGDNPVSGDWDDDGITEIGVFRPSTHMFYLDYNGNGAWNGGITDRAYNFGLVGDIGVSGDWDDDGITEIGVFRPSTHTFYLDYNGDGSWSGAVLDRAFNFGLTGDTPVPGRWYYDENTEIGVFRPSTHTFYLDYNGNWVWNGAVLDRAFNFGLSGDLPFSGDWSANKIGEIGVFRPSTHTFYLDWNGNGVWNGAVTDKQYNFGLSEDKPVSGVWG